MIFSRIYCYVCGKKLTWWRWEKWRRCPKCGTLCRRPGLEGWK